VDDLTDLVEDLRDGFAAVTGVPPGPADPYATAAPAAD
jgi:hypothetical protein